MANIVLDHRCRCKRLFYSDHDLTQHKLEYKHFICNGCDLKFATEYFLDQHLASQSCDKRNYINKNKNNNKINNRRNRNNVSIDVNIDSNIDMNNYETDEPVVLTSTSPPSYNQSINPKRSIHDMLQPRHQTNRSTQSLNMRDHFIKRFDRNKTAKNGGNSSSSSSSSSVIINDNVDIVDLDDDDNNDDNDQLPGIQTITPDDYDLIRKYKRLYNL